MSESRSPILAVLVAAGVIAASFALPRIPQDSRYHEMADQRSLISVPNALNVLSNVPFAIVGVAGLATTFTRKREASPFRTPWERWPAAVLFAGIGLTAFGSAYYHLAPDNGRLLWDRLPMTLGFIGLLTMVVAERVSIRSAQWLFVPLLAVGVGSVFYWYATELRGAGDLRPYGVLQFGSLAAIVVMLVIRRSALPGAGYLVAALAAYGAAKLLELTDRQIFAAGEIVSGHTLKHCAAAVGAALLVVMVRSRTRAAASAGAPPLSRVSPKVRVHLGCL